MLGFYPLGAAPFADDGAVNDANVDRLYPAAIVVEQPVVGTPDIAQVHGISAGAITAGAGEVGAPTLVVIYDLTAVGITAGVPTVGTSVIGQVHALTSTDVASTITVGTTQIGQTHVLASDGLTSTPTVDDSQIAQTHVLAPVGVTAGAAVVTASQIRQTHNMDPVDLTGAQPVFLPPGPRLRNRWALTANAIVAGAAVVQTATLGEFFAARRRYVTVTLSDDIQPVRDDLTEVEVAPSANSVVIEVDGTTIEVYDGANFAASDNANAATGAYVGQTKAE